jgi:hypothetical protein
LLLLAGVVAAGQIIAVEEAVAPVVIERELILLFHLLLI